jgi:hypothetical protein
MAREGKEGATFTWPQRVIMSSVSLKAFNRFPVRATEDMRDIGLRCQQLPPMLLWVDPNDSESNTAIENAIKCVTHLRRDGGSTTLLRSKAVKPHSPDVWTNPRYALQPNERLTLLRKDDPKDNDFAFVRTSTGVEGFVLPDNLIEAKATRVTRVTSTEEALAAIQGELRAYVSLPPSRFRVMTNNVRTENGRRNFNAGSEMAHAMRSMVSLPSSLSACRELN